MMSGTRDAPSSGEREGELTWRFQCRRSGRCCQVRGGVAWVSEEEQVAIAEFKQVTYEEFHATHVRELPDPATGQIRQALRDRADGACCLLDGANECSVYEARPTQCRDFPFWDSVTGDPHGFERARAVCPGIEAVPSETLRDRATAALAQILDDGPSIKSTCCPHENQGATLHISGLEVERIARVSTGKSPACPLALQGACGEPNAKPIACREWPSEEQRDAAFQQLHELELSTGFPQTIGAIPDLLLRREGVGYVPLSVSFTDPGKSE